MTSLLEATPALKPHRLPAPNKLLAATFAGTIFVSAFLLFQVQPLISKAILPWFGGSPAVWTTCMLFFQVLLFCGYAYAHAMTRFASPRVQLIVHLAVLVAALAFLPILPSVGWKPPDGAQPTWRILTLLLATVGLPYLLLSTTGPLVQAWFARTFVGQSPYRLYALSNIGSLLALLSFPFVFEPALELDSLAWLWSAGFVVFAALCAACAWRTLRKPPADDRSPLAASTPPAATKPTIWQRTLWVALPAFASLMLLAMTNHVCQDVAVIPFLWVAPLSIYLLSFIISFDHPRWYNRTYYSLVGIVLLLALAGIDDWPYLVSDHLYEPFELNFTTELIIYFAALYLICMLCHGELARLQPHPKHLTEYFLMMSAGGALGGLFVSLVAPRIFDTFFEWQIGLWGSFAVSCALAAFALRRLLARRRVLQTASLAAVGGAALLGSLLIVNWNRGDDDKVLYRNRNFYGRVSVYEYNIGGPLHHVSFKSGRVSHGEQYADPAKRHIPISYYGYDTGCGRALGSLADKSAARVGVIGLGAGAMLCYAKPGHHYRVYEINPEVIHIAKTFFTYFDDCEGTYDVVLGDARLSLERQEPQQFDALCLDAFSGDAIPTHLLTDEAFSIYDRHLKPDGLLVLHVTNSYLNLVPVVERLAAKHGYRWTRFYVPRDRDQLRFRSDYMILTKNDAFLAAHPPEVPDSERSTLQVPLWTDRCNNIFQLLK